ncbi:YeeE/YedE family protein [Devosia sp. CAU 1758]
MLTEFTPFHALAGGTLIGLASVALMALHGRVAGMTGIVSGLFVKGDRPWRLAFLVGAVAAPLFVWLVSGAPLPFASDVPLWAVLVSGLIVGAGVTFSGGCTSGHGVCGNARLSPRSAVATLTFMATAFTTVFVIRHLLGGF